MVATKGRLLRRRALRIEQSNGNPIYQFALTGKELLALADISRLDRSDSGKLIGYQRPAVRKHIRGIVDYLNGDKVVFPNSIILALSSSVRFTMSRGPKVDDGIAEAGEISIKIPSGSEKKPGWIVDGQQRALAISMSKRPDLPIPVSAFITDDIEVHRDQFIRVNNAKPLPRGLVTELLPEISMALPSNLAARRIPSAICDLLSKEKHSPFRGLIRRPSMLKKEGTAVIADASIVNMVQDSIQSPSGCLFPYRNVATGETDFQAIMQLLVTYWTAVKETFPEAWGKPPTKSRLMHGVGIRSMGRLMDKVMPTIPFEQKGASALVRKELAKIAPICRWTGGRWEDLEEVPWDSLQNVPRHIHALSNVLIRAYVQHRHASREIRMVTAEMAEGP